MFSVYWESEYATKQTKSEDDVPTDVHQNLQGVGDSRSRGKMRVFRSEKRVVFVENEL